MEANCLMPCGKKDCNGCEACKYDLPLETPLLKMKITGFGNFGLVPVGDNPSTAQIIIPGAITRHNVAPIGTSTQLLLPFKENNDSVEKSPYCNGCEHFLKIKRPNKDTTFNTRCSAESATPGGTEKVIKLNVYVDEKVKKPFWCPLIKKSFTNSFGDGIKVGDRIVYPEKNNSAMSNEQLENWNRSKLNKEQKEKWLAAPGITSWEELVHDTIYHLPPTLKRGRMDIKIINKYVSSIYAKNIRTNNFVWLYKEDEEFKYMSPLK